MVVVAVLAIETHHYRVRMAVQAEVALATVAVAASLAKATLAVLGQVQRVRVAVAVLAVVEATAPHPMVGMVAQRVRTTTQEHLSRTRAVVVAVRKAARLARLAQTQVMGRIMPPAQTQPPIVAAVVVVEVATLMVALEAQVVSCFVRSPQT